MVANAAAMQAARLSRGVGAGFHGSAHPRGGPPHWTHDSAKRVMGWMVDSLERSGRVPPVEYEAGYDTESTKSQVIATT
ncbi:hypothetical protein ACWCPI_38195 [Streptomyces sp. NPDC001920]